MNVFEEYTPIVEHYCGKYFIVKIKQKNLIYLKFDEISSKLEKINFKLYAISLNHAKPLTNSIMEKPESIVQLDLEEIRN